MQLVRVAADGDFAELHVSRDGQGSRARVRRTAGDAGPTAVHRQIATPEADSRWCEPIANVPAMDHLNGAPAASPRPGEQPFATRRSRRRS